MRRLAGKNALVTGGASGLGRATAQRLAADGATVVISDLNRGLGERTAAELRVGFLPQDVTAEDQWPAVIGEIETTHGALGILVNNAGIAGPADAVSPENTRLADWKQIMSVNLDGVFLGCRAGIAAMRRGGGGSIINMSSIAALLATPDSTAYGASKAAVRQLTKSVAQYCAEQRLGVRCNSVHPGEVRTPLWEGYLRGTTASAGVAEEVLVAGARSRVPLGDFRQPADIAAAVSFLCSDDARFITGAEIVVDGGVVHCDTYVPPSPQRFPSPAMGTPVVTSPR